MSRGAFRPIFRSFSDDIPDQNFVKQGRWQHYDPVPFFRSEAARQTGEEDPRLRTGNTGNREKTNPWGAVKPEISGNGKAADDRNNRLFSGVSLVSRPNRQNPHR